MANKEKVVNPYFADNKYLAPQKRVEDASKGLLASLYQIGAKCYDTTKGQLKEKAALPLEIVKMFKSFIFQNVLGLKDVPKGFSEYGEKVFPYIFTSFLGDKGYALLKQLMTAKDTADFDEAKAKFAPMAAQLMGIDHTLEEKLAQPMVDAQ